MNTFYFLFSFLTLRMFFLGGFLVEGPSMEPTLHSNEVVLINENVKSVREYNRGDIVVFSLADDPEYYYIKRIIGLPGEKLQIKKDGVYVDDGSGYVKQDEPYAIGDSVSSIESYRGNSVHTYAVPKNKFFVMGDNRSQSKDSRYFDFVPFEDMKGKYLFNLMGL